MKLAVISTTLLATVAPVASAWRLRLYEHPSYLNKIWDQEGSDGGESCTRIVGLADKRANSMKWDSDGDWWNNCRVQLFTSQECEDEHKVADSGESNWNVPRFTKKAANKVRAYNVVDCPNI